MNGITVVDGDIGLTYDLRYQSLAIEPAVDDSRCNALCNVFLSYISGSFSLHHHNVNGSDAVKLCRQITAKRNTGHLIQSVFINREVHVLI